MSCNSIFVAPLLIALVWIWSSGALHCKSGWTKKFTNEYDQVCYKKLKNSDYVNSVRQCKEADDRSHLAIIEDVYEAEDLYEAVGYGWFWYSGSDREKEGRWIRTKPDRCLLNPYQYNKRWSQYNNLCWAEDEPDGKDKENCMTIRVEKSWSMFYDEKCTRSRATACQIRKRYKCDTMCKVPTIANGGVVFLDSDQDIELYESIKIYCRRGFILPVEASESQICRSQWNGANLEPGKSMECKAICPNLDQLNNGKSSYEQQPSYSGTAVNFTCNEGYTLNGTSKSVCMQDGTWKKGLPTCARDGE